VEEYQQLKEVYPSPYMVDGVVVASISKSKDLIKTRIQCEETKIDLPWAIFIVGSHHLCDQAINLSGKTMIPLSC
jgi:hypothetical protein